MSKKKIILLLVFAGFLVGCHQTNTNNKSATKSKNATGETVYEYDIKQENSTSAKDTLEKNKIKNDDSLNEKVNTNNKSSKINEINITQKSAVNQEQHTNTNKTETKKSSNTNQVIEAVDSKANSNQSTNSNSDQQSVPKENVSDKNSENASQEKPKEDTSTSQKYYFAKCDCGYLVESHESFDDAVSKLFAAGHGNSYEHSGYVAGGDLD